QLYNITIIATDHGKPSLSSESFALLRTSSDPNTTPKFKPIESITISEATELGTIVATFEAKAGSAIISYQLIDNSMHFELDPYSGELMLVKPLDYEAAQELSLTIMAKTKTANNTQQIRITITDENDHEPIILTDVFTIQENQPGGSIVGNILVSDMDSGTNAEVELDIIYQIPLGDEFSIQRSNLVANKALDREHIDKYHVMVRARDSGKPPKESRKIVTVLVGDQNELPSCNTMLNFYISSANMPFRQKIQCQDLDEGLNGSLGFHLLNETLANFITLAEDGTLTVHTRPKDPITTLHMIVSDRNDILNKNDPLRTSIEVHVTLINKREENEAILFTQSSYRFKVFLDISIGSMIGLIQTKSQSERQFYLTGMRTKVKTILYGIPFAIDKNSGELRLIHMLTSANEYLLDIVAVDSEGNTKSVQVIIEVDMPPVDFFLIERAFFEFSINESLPVGTVVGNLTLREKTSDVRFKWLKETKDNLPFTIDETSGRITVTNSLDFEQHTFYHAIVEIYTSKRVETVLILFNILNANDNVPTFNSTSLNFFVREGASIGSLIGKANAIDLDSNAQVRYQLIGAPQIATIDAFSGILRVSKEIDHDEAAFYKFKIRATDQAGLFSEVTAYLFIEDTNNHPPLILSSEHKAEIDEGASVGTFVYQFQFMDPDSVHNFNFRIEPQGDPFQQFVIDNEGRVSLANPLDREIMSQYKLTVVLCDDYPPSIVHCIKSRIEITVRDVNDNHPEFESPTTFLVSENAAIGAVVGTLNAFDKDLGINSTILFRITPESLPNNEFFVDPLLGYLEVNTQLDREIVVSYTFIVEAYDSGWPRLFTRQEITVRVIDEDDNGPELVDMLENPIELLENVPIGHRVTCLKYTDLDQDANAAAFFEVVDGNVDQHFRIGSLSGCLYVNSVLDFEKRQAYLLNISMKGFVNDSLESFITINIFIRDINDEQPYFVDGNTIRFNVSKRFQGTYPTSLGLLYAKDRDLVNLLKDPVQ
uniref:Cadherin domain-containing protein n=1 Tax=Acrobeloides nanus TaxID=290746 RepID=A0A914EK77_9BILA